MIAYKIDISIIVPLYKGGKYCYRLLEMLDTNILYKNLYKKCAMEVIFVNDYPDERISLFENKYYEVVLIEHEINKGIHAARIDGIQRARGDYIIMFDQDDLIREMWLYSQWEKITESCADYCVCNGWSNRFKIIWNNKEYEKKISDIDHYISVGNAILSPGQVIIRKDAIPQEWMNNIQRHNGADDYLLWIMALKQERKFVVNDECLFYHTPERTRDSVTTEGMRLSLKETLDILLYENFLNTNEKEILLCRINQLEARMGVRTNQILYRWMKLKLRGVNISDYFRDKGIHEVAIYGLGAMGQLLYEELQLSEISVMYGIDKVAKDFRGKLKIYKLEEDLDSVDAIIVSILNLDGESLKFLQDKVKCPIIALPDILVSLEEMSIGNI